MDSLKKQLQKLIKGKTVLVGMGNPLKADDGMGSMLVQTLKGKVTAELIDAGTTPENYLGPITRVEPATVIIIDTLHFNKPPGTIKLFTESDFTTLNLSTHAMNPGFFINYLKDKGITNILFLGVQPAHVSLGGEMSKEVKRALNKLEGLLFSLLTDNR
jgi:hydrogenase 3 maturation protease